MGILIKLIKTFILLFTITNLANAGDLSVQPLYMEFKPEKNLKEKPFEIKVMSKKDMKLNVNIYEAKQTLSGKLDFFQINQASHEVIKLESSKIALKNNKSSLIKGTVNFPRKINKTLLYAVMIEEDKTAVNGGVGINVRFAVIFKIRTSSRKTVVISNFEVIGFKKIDNKLLLEAKVINLSPNDFNVQAKATIRNKSNKTIESLDLKSGSAWQRDDSRSIVFPGNTVMLYGLVKKLDTAGTYKTSVRGKIDNRKSISSSKSFTLTEKDLPSTTSKKTDDNLVSLSPSNFEVFYKEKGLSYYRFKISNNSTEKLTIKLPNGENGTKLNYEYVFSPNKLDLLPSKDKVILLKTRSNKGPGFKVKDLELIVFNSKGEKLKSEPLPIEFIEKP